MEKNGVCIVTTVRNAGDLLDFFVNYHLGTGFSRLFVFLEDPAERVSEAVASNERVSILRYGDLLTRVWEKQSLYRQLKPHLHWEVMARQLLNVEVAIKLALEYGLEWMLHIDADELFYAEGLTVEDHFADMSRQGVAVTRYWNHEAVPETPDCASVFEEVTLFKRNSYSLGADAAKVLWSFRTPKDYFNFYNNGKSAARLHKKLVPLGVHAFGPGTGQLTLSNPCVLHYACASFRHFWEKYRLLGPFSDQWFGRIDIKDRVGTHLDARDVVMAGDVASARQFYRQRFMMEDQTTRDTLLHHQVLKRIRL